MRILSLGTLIYELEQMPEKKEVLFDFCNYRPTTLGSWRGDYSQLALGFTEYDSEEIRVTVKDLLRQAKVADGKVFEGYKGGEFEMHDGTRLWVSNYGESGSTIITGITHNEYQAIIHTAYADYEEAMASDLG